MSLTTSAETAAYNKVEDENKAKASALKTTEDAAEGSVAFRVYWAWFKYGGLGAFFSLVFLIILSNAINLYAGIWLGDWTADGNNDDKFAEYAGVYFALGAGQALFMGLAWSIYIGFVVRANRRLHSTVLDSVSRAPSSFFDTTPLGRILNRFGRDLDSVDMLLPQSFIMFLNLSLVCLSIVVSTAVGSPWLLIILPFVAVGFYFFQKWYRKTAIALQRIESVARSPIFSHFQQTMTGITTIRAYGAKHLFELANHYRDRKSVV